ncbi:MAG: hypothetical protein LIO92_01080 [Clostridiales bacterium]|nr:hypothetical protein [Clostridiales bacterium]
MTEEILAVKLNEFDRLFTRMHDLIQTSNSFSREQLREEINALNEEYTSNELHVRNSILQSKAATSGMGNAYWR